jgi:thiamine biosynthesis lipoprotein
VKTCLYILTLLHAFTSSAQVLENADEAFALSRQQQKPVFLIFSGSDWCVPCIRLQNTILNDTGFISFASRQLILLKADFPQRKKMSKELIEQNEKLAEQYNADGNFPELLLLLPDRSKLSVVEFKNQSPHDFIQELTKLLREAGMLKEYSRQDKLMGSAFEFIVTAGNDAAGAKLLDECAEEVRRIETIFTEFSETSQTSLINRNAAKQFVAVDDEVYQLIERSLHISKLTSGAFDISSGILKKLYRFRGEDFSLPSKEKIKEALSKTGYKKIKLLPAGKVMLSADGMHIGFGAIGKGYAADKVKEMLIAKGVQCGVVNASGDLTAWGIRPNGEAWKTGIAHPDDPAKIIVWLPVNGQSIATSGNYIQYFEMNGVRYSHNIDPLTGLPVQGIKSVTVISPSAELSDALATAVTVMGQKAGLHLINQLPQTHCMMIDDNNKMFYSDKLNIEYAA